MKIFINPFRNPRAWAQRSVGSVAAFSSGVIGTIVFGLGVMVLVSMMSRGHTRDFGLAVYVVVAVGVIGFPVLYLMMLRLLLCQYNEEIKKHESQEENQ